MLGLCYGIAVRPHGRIGERRGDVGEEGRVGFRGFGREAVPGVRLLGHSDIVPPLLMQNLHPVDCRFSFSQSRPRIPDT